MADDEEILVKEAVFKGFLNEYNSYIFKKSRKVLYTMWDFYVIVGNRNFENGTMELKDYAEAKISLKCNNLKRSVLVKGKILFQDKKSENIQQEFESSFEEGGSSFDFIVENIERKRQDIKCELQFYASRENAFYLICKHLTDPLESKMDSLLQFFKKNFDKDMLNLYQEGLFSDVTLHCDSETFKVHKCVLANRSKVFSAMFQNPMKESESGVVQIKEISSDTLQALLKYIYLNELPKFNDTSLYDLLAAADMYDLRELKFFCILKLQSTLSIENALLTLSYADLYARSLKKKCINFICKEFYHLKHTQEWQTLEKEKPILVNEVLETFNALVKYYCDKIGSVKERPESFNSFF